MCVSVLSGASSTIVSSFIVMCHVKGRDNDRSIFLNQSRDLFDHNSTSKLWISLDLVDISLNRASAMSRDMYA